MPALTPILSAILLFSTVAPSKTWFAPSQPIQLDVKPGGEATLVLTDFAGKALEPKGSADVTGDKTVNDLRELFPQLSRGGTYVLYLVKKVPPPPAAADAAAPEAVLDLTKFIGTPLVIGVREDKRRNAPPGPMVVKVEPLRYAVMRTEQGPIPLAFYYDVAPNTTTSFLTLAEQGYFDGLTFHRILPTFVIQGGDPRGDGRGGPGYELDAEFSTRKHEAGVLSMARTGDPQEPDFMPRKEFADSAGSQFFVCLEYNRNTKGLDGRYTAFGKVVGDGMKAVQAIAAVPLADKDAGRPEKPPVIQKVEVKAVTSGDNPYIGLLKPPGAPPAAGAK